MGTLQDSDHMVQKPPYWDANCPLGHLKQRKFRLTSFVLDVPVRNLRPSMADISLKGPSGQKTKAVPGR